jgi:hypothetical protein
MELPWKRAERISTRTAGPGLETKCKGIEQRGQEKETQGHGIEPKSKAEAMS